MKSFKTLSLQVEKRTLFLLDQTQLPHQEVWIKIESLEEMLTAIKRLQVRGAPLIGISASLFLALEAQKKRWTQEQFRNNALKLRESRPTAVNLMHCLDNLINFFDGNNYNNLEEKAYAFVQEDIQLCNKIAHNGAKLFTNNDHILTHCNTGGLATAGVGTALGVIKQAHQSYQNISVFVDETRPLLQGARLTTYELEKAGVPYQLICDNMAAMLMQQDKVSKVIVGADRIARNGDFANKIGTYSLAVLCHYHQVPFYVAAPYTTVDKECASGKEIPIEERPAMEVQREWAPVKSPVYNPAFDVTPADLVTGWIFDQGVYSRKEIKEGILC